MRALDERLFPGATRRSFRGEIPVLLTLPLKFERRPRRRHRQTWRALIVALLLLGVALLAAATS
jgi:hypothetical protein